MTRPSRPAKRPLRQFDAYTTGNGQRALAVSYHLRDHAAFYQPEWQLDFWDGGLGYNRPSEWVNRRFASTDEMGAYCADYVIPPVLRQMAQRASAELVDAFMEVSAIRIVRDQEAGLLDPQKLPALVAGLLSNTYRAEDVQPYLQILPTPAKKPVIGLVASAGNAEMHQDPLYIPRIGALALGIAWACEAAGLEAVSALTRGADGLRPVGEWAGKVDTAIHPHYLVQPNISVPPRCYAAALSVTLWQHGIIELNRADRASYQRMMNLFGGAYKNDPGGDFLSDRGGRGVDWLRQCHQPDITIAVGRLSDAGDADIVLDRKFDLAQAARDIAAQARKLVR